MRFLGKSTQGGGSPTLYATDRGSYVVQGWRVPGSGDRIEIPHRLLGHAEPDTYLGASLTDTGRGSFLLSGRAVTDRETLSQMDVPGHEAVVEVPKELDVRGRAAGAG